MARYPSTVKLNSRGDDVKLLQEKLNSITGNSAGVAYVASAYIYGGKVSSLTLKVREKPSSNAKEIGTLKSGDTVVVVRDLGVWSEIKYGTSKLEISGFADTDTVNAIKDFQKSNKLVADGVCGEKTWGLILPKFFYYRQNGQPYSSKMYSAVNNPSQTIGNSACGPTSAAMCVASLTGKEMSVPEFADMAVKNGFRTANSGTSWGYFAWVARRYGLKCRQTGSMSEMLTAIDRGAFVVASMGPGYFTKGGHYICLWSRNKHSKTIYALDPASAGRTDCSESLMARESKQFFIFER